ncbi:MAG: type II secretion system protein GspH, partial [Thiothrix nivea]
MRLPRGAAGFNLLEVLLVLVIAGLLMGVVATSLTEGPVLRKTAKEVAASLRHARSVAVLQQKEVVWSMDVSNKQFWVGGQDKKRDLHPTIEARINTARSEVVSSTQGNIRFYPDGSSTGGSVELTARNQTFKVNVEWISGR